MAHACCPNGHGMWNGDGKPIVWAFRVGYFRDFMKRHPDCKLDEAPEYRQLYDCVYDAPGEDLDCWYCDECKGLVVYVDDNIARYDFKRMETLPEIKSEELAGWEDYIALRDKEFEDFQDFYQGKNPIEAIEQYGFTYRYKLSPDKKMFYALDGKGKVAFGYYRSNYTEFSPKMEKSIEEVFPEGAVILAGDPMPDMSIENMRQVISSIETVQQLVDAYVSVHNKFWFINDGLYDYDEGTEEYEKLRSVVDAWGDMMEELDKRVMLAADEEGLLAEKQPNFGMIKQLERFMDKYGYRDGCGWWVKI